MDRGRICSIEIKTVVFSPLFSPWSRQWVQKQSRCTSAEKRKETYYTLWVRSRNNVGPTDASERNRQKESRSYGLVKQSVNKSIFDCCINISCKLLHVDINEELKTATIVWTMEIGLRVLLNNEDGIEANNNDVETITEPSSYPERISRKNLIAEPPLSGRSNTAVPPCRLGS